MGTHATHMTHNGENTVMLVTEVLMESQRVSEKAARKTMTGQLRANQRLAESFADGLMKTTVSQTEAYLDAVQVFLDHSKKQQDVLRELAESSTRACMDLCFSPFLALRTEEETIRRPGPGREKSPNGHVLPVENYDQLNVEEVSRRLEGLDAREIEELKTYEKHHKNRTSLIERFDRSLAE